MIRYGWFYWFRLEEMCVRNIGYFVDYRFPRCFWVANLTYISERFVSGFSSLGLGALKHVSRLVTEPVKPGFRMSFHSEDPVIEYTSVGFVFFDTHCIGSVSINGMPSTWSLNSLLLHKYVGRLVAENTLPLQFLLTFHDTCKSVAKCSRSVSRFRTCGFHLSLPKGSKCGVG